ncbi:MAG: peptide chain release factor N(5)-glutamine methyltransferase [Candidatus Omnitrophica bacterium]|nr:peptide chain release factor N(5)-glutamine methyltransferase [Candidatus Omnitrophota bacterium]
MNLKDWLKAQRGALCENEVRFVWDVRFPEEALPVLGDVSLSRIQLDVCNEIVRRKRAGTPLPYILGREMFYGLMFEVNSSVLIPRPETERITERALACAGDGMQVLDLCSGCGNIAVVLKTHLPGLRVYGADSSAEALEVAAANARRHGVSIDWIHADLFSGVRGRRFDLIVSNPPYVAPEEIRGTLCAEPRSALDGGREGTAMIDRILRDAPAFLKKKGHLILEIGYNHKEYVARQVSRAGCYSVKEWIVDYAGISRGVVLQHHQERKYG